MIPAWTRVSERLDWRSRRSAADRRRSFRDEPVAGHGVADPTGSKLGAEQWGVAPRRVETLDGGVAHRRVAESCADVACRHLVGAARPMRAQADAPPRACDEDQWDGYPAERAQAFAADRETGRTDRLASCHGDSRRAHPPRRRRRRSSSRSSPLALTSQNLDEKVRLGSARGEPSGRSWNCRPPCVAWCELDSHGYTVVDVTRRVGGSSGGSSTRYSQADARPTAGPASEIKVRRFASTDRNIRAGPDRPVSRPAVNGRCASADRRVPSTQCGSGRHWSSQMPGILLTSEDGRSGVECAAIPSSWDIGGTIRSSAGDAAERCNRHRNHPTDNYSGEGNAGSDRSTAPLRTAPSGAGTSTQPRSDKSAAVKRP